MINATELSKSFGGKKIPAFWLRTNAAQEYINAYISELQICNSAVIKVVKGGSFTQGTWMHPDIAIEYARWLNPRFGIWCNLRIQELLKNGYAISEEFKKEMNEKMQSLYLIMEKMQHNHNVLMQRNQELETIIQRDRAKCLTSQTYSRTYTVTEISNELDMQPEELNNYLRRNRVQHKIDGFWELKLEYQGQGYAVTKYGNSEYFESDGSHYAIPYHYLAWTPKGREMILEMYKIYE